MPISIDAITYYNRIVKVPDLYVPSDTWQMGFLETTPTTGERFVDYSGFTYDREAMFPGCSTWLDVATLTWKVSPVLEAVDFLDLPPIAGEDGTLTDIAAFAQMADDVRSVINYLHENDVVAGFSIDPVFENSCDEQAAALVNPATTWGPVPEDLIQTVTTSTTAAAYMPWAGTPVASAALRFTVAATDAGAAFTAADQVQLLLGPTAEPVTLTVEGGALVGQWAPSEGLALPAGARVTTDVTLTVGASAPVGAYALTLDLVDLVDLATGEPVATDVALTQVHDDTPTVLWTDIDGYAAQATFVPATARVVNPVTQPALAGADLRITVDALTDFTAAGQVAAWSEAVPATFTLVEGNLVALWPLPALEPGYDALITWYLNVAAGAPLGDYVITLDLLADGGTVLGTDVVGTQIIAPSEHGGDGGGGDGGGGDGDGGDGAVLPLTPARLADTTDGWVAADGLFEGDGMVAAGGTLTVDVAGRAGVPADAEAAVLNVTIADATGVGYATVYPCGADVPTSSLNYTRGSTVANEVIAQLAADGTVCVFTHAGARVVVDVSGYVPKGSGYTPVTPYRLADTTASWVAADELFTGTGPVLGGRQIQVPVAGRAGVPTDALAAVLNVTIADPAAGGYATVYPCSPEVGTSTLNFRPGETVANEVVAKISEGGTVCVFTYATARVVVDVVGYFPENKGYTAVTPMRLADTRSGFEAADGQFTGTGLPAAGSVVTVPVAGRAGLPADAAVAVLNVTVADPTGVGFATVFPCGERPPTSTLNLMAGRTVANEVLAPVSDAGTVCVYTYAPAHVVVDVVGHM